MKKSRVVIMGAAGRDFHNFNTYFRDNEKYHVVAFTAAQIPNIDGRCYPASLAGSLYPDGIPITAEEDMPSIIKNEKVDQVIFAYSDISHSDLMHKASWVLSLGADFRLMGNSRITLRSNKPVISVCAVRTGAGKSQTTRRICSILREKGLKVVVVRHPMPYGDLTKQAVQRFGEYADLETQDCTIEEREEYEPLIDNGIVVYAGVDYERILREAEKEADVIVWDGGNNDLPFYESNLHIVLTDPHRPGHEISYHPGEVNLRLADVVIINKVQTADRRNILRVKENIAKYNPTAIVIEAASPIKVDDPSMVKGKRALVVEDGPTLTHGGMAFGAGTIAAEDNGALDIIDPRPYAVRSVKEMYEKYRHLGPILPAMGYTDEQIEDMEETINRADCDVVVAGTPVDLRRIMNVNKPIVRVRYELVEIGKPDLVDIIDQELGPILKVCDGDSCKVK
ncbi:MAG TPA: cyclic 2,3-diphosphoglycerate synthase [Methanomassiliicoccales archaeon]|nr:cyclic 2,3-diphosphoglycerate synthase [Methanomassiliicoccales archaeon]